MAISSILHCIDINGSKKNIKSSLEEFASDISNWDS